MCLYDESLFMYGQTELYINPICLGVAEVCQIVMNNYTNKSPTMLISKYVILKNLFKRT